MPLRLLIALFIFNAYLLPARGQKQSPFSAAGEDQQLVAVLSETCHPHFRIAMDKLPDKEAVRSIAGYVHDAEQRFHKNASDTQAFVLMQKALDVMQSQNFPLTEAYLNYRLARILYEEGRFALTVEHMLYAREMIPSGDYNLMPYAGSFLSFLGSMYCLYGDYQLGLQYLLQSNQYKYCSDKDIYNMYGNLGLAYYKLGYADSGIWACMEALKVAYTLKDSVEIGNMSGNLGVTYFLKQDYISAIQYLQKDFDINSYLGEWASASGALLMQAKAYLMQKKADMAYDNLEMVDSIFSFCKCSVPASQKEYYDNLSLYYRQKGDFRNAVRYQDSFFKYTQIANNVNNSSTFKNLELGVVARMHETKMKFLESERKRQVLTRNIVVISSFLVLVIIGLLLYVQWRRRKVEQHMFRLKLNNAESRLKTYLENIKDKNNLLDQLNMELEKMRDMGESGNALKSDEHEEIEILSKIKSASLITEDGWREFTELVELVHHHFFVRLHKQYPGLTPAEVRIFTLVKLNFSIKEMAGMLGISPDSVRKSKQRVRKKLNLSEAESLEDIVTNI